jgi:hypothetical protein
MDFHETRAIHNEEDLLYIGINGFGRNQFCTSIFRNTSFESAVGLKLKKL